MISTSTIHCRSKFCTMWWQFYTDILQGVCIPAGKKLSSKRDFRKNSQEDFFASLSQETTIYNTNCIKVYWKACWRLYVCVIPRKQINEQEIKEKYHHTLRNVTYVHLFSYLPIPTVKRFGKQQFWLLSIRQHNYQSQSNHRYHQNLLIIHADYITVHKSRNHKQEELLSVLSH